MSKIHRFPLPAEVAADLRDLFADPRRVGQGLPDENAERVLDLARWQAEDEQASLLLSGRSQPWGTSIKDLPALEGLGKEPHPGADGRHIVPLRVPLLPSGVGGGRVFGALLLRPRPGAELERLGAHASALLLGDALGRAASTDALTGLLSRRAFERALPAVSERLADGEATALLMLDLDGLRALNAARGARSGDQLLHAVGMTLSQAAGTRGLACRYGGDELALLLPGAGGEQALEAARDLCTTVAALPGFGRTPSLSVGVAWGPEQGDSAEALVLRADQALARAKQLGGGQSVGWEPSLRRQARADRLAGILTGSPERDYRHVAALLDTVRAVSSLAPLDETLREIVDRCVTITGAERGLLLLRGDGTRWEARVARKRGCGALDGEPDFAASIADEALERGEAVARLAEEEAPISPSADAMGLTAVLCVPLRGEDVPRGVIYVDAAAELEPFDPATIAFADALAGETATALRNAALYDQLLARNHRLSADVAGREQELVRVRRRWAQDRRTLAATAGVEGLVGRSPAMREVFELLTSLRGTRVAVLVEGESGTGKELAARAIHRDSPRAEGPLVTVNCAAIAPSLFESELFGHASGAFTGAHGDRVGLLEAAQGGTVFLDEVGELPLEAQAKLLRALQEREVRRVGESSPRSIDVRVLAATNRDLRAMVADGEFRKDLYYRLAVFRIRLPPLRERPEDLPLLAEHLLADIRSRGTSTPGLSAAAAGALVQRPWPGNVRQLRNVLERAAVLAGDAPIAVAHLGEPEDAHAPGGLDAGLLLLPLKEARSRFSAIYARAAVERAGGSVPAAAKLAGVTRQTLYRLMS